MSNAIEKMYISQLVNTCKIMTINNHVIGKSGRDIFMASLLSTIHYGTQSIEIIDRIIDDTEIKTCEVTVMINCNFSVIDALLEYRDSIIKSYFTLHKIDTKNISIKKYY